MMKISLMCISVLLYTQVSSDKKVLPPYLKICRRNDPDLSGCVKSSIEDLKPHMAKGIPEMRIPAFNPFHYVEIGYDTGTVKFDFTDTDLALAHEFDLHHVDMNIEECSISMNVTYPLLDVSGHYRLVGKISFLELDGEGSFTGNITSIEGSFTLYCSHETKKGVEYLKFKDIDLKLKIEDVKLQLNDLFKNNKQLTDTTNAAINENSKALAADFETFLAKGIGEAVLRIAQGVFDRFPLDVLFPK